MIESMPQSFECEKAIIGAFLIENDLYIKYSTKMSQDMFYNIELGIVYEYMISGNTTSPRLIKERFPHLAELVNTCISSFDGSRCLDNEIGILRDRLYRRCVIKACNEAIQKAATDWETPGMAIAEKAIQDLSKRYDPGNEPEHIKTILPRVMDSLQAKVTGKSPNPKTGLIDVDGILGDFKPGEVSIIAARPSMGKTSFVNCIILNEAIVNKLPILFFSLEMTKEAIAGRMLFTEADASYGSALVGSKKDLIAVGQSLNRIAESNIFIDDSTGVTVNNIFAKSEMWVKKHGIKIIFIDHRGFIKPIQKGRSTHEEVTEISKGLVEVAKKLNIPVVLVSQLSRKVEDRRPPVPMLSDLRESGSLEEDARKVIFLYRDEYYNQDSKKKGVVDIIIAKNDNGQTGTAEAVFDKSKMKFRNKLEEGGFNDFMQ